jgi:hypothetical protein
MNPVTRRRPITSCIVVASNASSSTVQPPDTMFWDAVVMLLEW